MSSDLIGGYLTFYLNQPIKWADFRRNVKIVLHRNKDIFVDEEKTTGEIL
jgi:hypothetical protein